MANRVYIRKIDSHCVDKEISFTADVHKKVFLDETAFDIIGKRTGTQGKVTVGMATDRRFNGDMKEKENSEVEEYNYNQIKNKLLQHLWEDVHKSAMAEHPLFRDDISTFGDAYMKLNSHENVFCKDFCDMFVVKAVNKNAENGADNSESDGGSDGPNEN